MTTLCGFARTSCHLLLARVGVGIGEAGGTPPSTSILADKFPPARRPMALTIYALGACLGAWLGSSVAGAAAQRGGWRAAFLVLGIPGLVLAAIVWLTVREPRRGALDSTRARSAERVLGDAALHRHPALGGASAGGRLSGHALELGTDVVDAGISAALPPPERRQARVSCSGRCIWLPGTASTLLAGWLRRAPRGRRSALRGAPAGRGGRS